MLPQWFKLNIPSEKERKEWQAHYAFLSQNLFSEDDIKLIFDQAQYNKEKIRLFVYHYSTGLTGKSPEKDREFIRRLLAKKTEKRNCFIKCNFELVHLYYDKLNQSGFTIDQLIRIFNFSGGAESIPELLTHFETLSNLGYDRKEVLGLINKRSGEKKIQIIIEHHSTLMHIGLNKIDILRTIGAYGGVQAIQNILKHHPKLTNLGFTWTQLAKWVQKGNGSAKIKTLIENSALIKQRRKTRLALNVPVGNTNDQEFEAFLIENGIKLIKRKRRSAKTASASNSLLANKRQRAAAGPKITKQPKRTARLRMHNRNNSAAASCWKRTQSTKRIMTGHASASRLHHSRKNQPQFFAKKAEDTPSAASSSSTSATAKKLQAWPSGISGLCEAAIFSNKIDKTNPLLLRSYISAFQLLMSSNKHQEHLEQALIILEKLSPMIRQQQGLMFNQEERLEKLTKKNDEQEKEIIKHTETISNLQETNNKLQTQIKKLEVENKPAAAASCKR